MVPCMVATDPRPLLEKAGEARRRSLLAESDSLLEDVEALRLDDQTEAPDPLRHAIHALQVRLGRRDPPMPPATLHAAHDLVFAVQQRLMAANPNVPRPNRHDGRPGGQPLMMVVRDDRRSMSGYANGRLDLAHWLRTGPGASLPAGLGRLET